MAAQSNTPSDSTRYKSSAAPSSSSSTLETENPFIAFRRFADSQISALLQSVLGLPSLFAQPDSNHRWTSIDEIVAKRRKALLRAREEFIDELEEDMRGAFGDKNERIKRRDREMQKWGAFLDDSNADHLKEGRTTGKVSTKNEERLGWDGKQRTGENTPSQEMQKDRDERFIVSTPKGEADLCRVVDSNGEGQGFWTTEEDAMLNFNTIRDQDPFSNPDQGISWLLTDVYSPLYLDRTLTYKLHPSFYKSDPDDSYFRRDYQHGDLYPCFSVDSAVHHDPRLATKVDWRTAFQDLLDCHHQGYFSQPSQRDSPYPSSTPMSAGNWIAHLIDTGSLGSRWSRLSTPESPFAPFRFRYGNSSEAWAVLPFTGPFFIKASKFLLPLAESDYYERNDDSLPLIRSLTGPTDPTTGVEDELQNEGNESMDLEDSSACPDRPGIFEQIAALQDAVEDACDTIWQSYRPAFTKAAISLTRDPDTEQSTLRTVDRVLRLIENPELSDNADCLIAEACCGLDLQSPTTFKGIVHMLDQSLRDDHYEEWKDAKKAVDAEHPAVYGVNIDETGSEKSNPSATTVPGLLLSSSSSSSTYSCNYDSSDDWSPNSIISTLTTTEVRTLPDGSTETKRVLKKRFADGREEKNETTETRSGGTDHVADKPVSEKPKKSERDISVPFAGPAEDKNKKRGGWFWN